MIGKIYTTFSLEEKLRCKKKCKKIKGRKWKQKGVNETETGKCTLDTLENETLDTDYCPVYFDTMVCLERTKSNSTVTSTIECPSTKGIYIHV